MRLKIALLCFQKDAGSLKEILGYLKSKYETDMVIYRKDIWRELMKYDCIVAYMPSGIVIRGVCSYLKNKWVDPAIVILDKSLLHCIPILGGHHGGNKVAKFLEKRGLRAVITTTMEYTEGFVAGVGFRKISSAEEIVNALKKALKEVGCGFNELRVIATVESKRDSEIVKVANILKKPLIFVKKDEINRMEIRETRAKLIGVKNVSEACAIISSVHGELVLPKRTYGGVTVAIAR